MQASFSLKSLSLAVAITLTLTACGGGSSGNTNNNTGNTTNTQPTTAVGIFVDSAVEGIEVFQDGKSLGKTNAKGEYTYHIKGGAVSFKLGTLTLGSTMPKAVITPADLQTDTNQITRILQILQSVDNDNNTSNGIQISESVAKRFETADFKSLVKETDNTKFENALKPKLNTNQAVKNQNQALNHFNQTAQSDDVKKSDGLVKTAKGLEGYWKDTCDSNKQVSVFEIKAINNMLKVMDTKVYQYDTANCSGSPISAQKVDSKNRSLTLTGLGGTNTSKTAQAISNSDVSGIELVTVNYGDNYLNFDKKNLQRVKNLNDLTVVANPSNTDVKKAVENMTGYWQSVCQDNSDNPDEEFQSKQEFFYSEKTTDDTITVTKSIDVFYNQKACQGSQFVVADIRPEPHTLSDPQTTNGKTSFSATNSDGERVTINSNVQFTLGETVYQKTSKTVFDNWFSKANFTKDNNKTVPVVTNMKFDRASGNNLAKLTVTFNTNMHLLDYHTEGAYNPAKSYWLNKTTFVVEFNSYVPNGTIALTGKGFRNSGGVRLAEEVKYTFPTN